MQDFIRHRHIPSAPLVLLILAGLLLPQGAFGIDQAASADMDVVKMSSGKVFSGVIVDEDNQKIRLKMLYKSTSSLGRSAGPRLMSRTFWKQDVKEVSRTTPVARKRQLTAWETIHQQTKDKRKETVRADQELRRRQPNPTLVQHPYAQIQRSALNRRMLQNRSLQAGLGGFGGGIGGFGGGFSGGGLGGVGGGGFGGQGGGLGGGGFGGGGQGGGGFGGGGLGGGGFGGGGGLLGSRLGIVELITISSPTIEARVGELPPQVGLLGFQTSLAFGR